jgi:thiol-disulfide isomerase/thioredoxin
MRNKILPIIICFSVFLGACTQKDKKCIISGKVINRPYSTQLRLTKAFVDFRSQSAILIPIKDSSFMFEFNFKNIEAYTLVFHDEFIQGSMHPITFFNTNGKIEMTLYPLAEGKMNIISGGKENALFLDYQRKKNNEIDKKTKFINDSIAILIANDEYDSQQMKTLNKKLENTKKPEDISKLNIQINKLYKSGEGLSSSARELNTKNDSIRKIIQDKEDELIKENITIPNFYLLIQAIQSSEYYPKIYDFDKLIAIQKEYAMKFNNHPYTKYSNEIIWRIANMRPGGDFFDFILPDLDGKEFMLSKEIEGKYAFIDIWAPWCGPCISKSREMKPLFEEYKDKGFTVIGVASKYLELSDVKKLLEKEIYPWITLIDKPEIDSRINEHYGIEMAGGACILVDKKGKIVLYNPSVEDVRRILASNL